MNRWLATVALFLVCAFSLPCLYYIVYGGGILPILAMIALTIMSFDDAGISGWGLLFVHVSLVNVAVWSAVVFSGCYRGVRAMYARFTATVASIVIGALIIGAAGIGLSPIYWVARHGTPVRESAYDLFFQMVRRTHQSS